MNIAIIGRSQLLYNTVLRLIEQGHIVKVIITAKAAAEYTKDADDFKNIAKKISAPFFITQRLDKPELMLLLEGLDITVSVNWISRIKQKHINLFKIGILNAHMGDLPRYRGNACPNWAIINGEKEITISIHLMEATNIDCGRIITQGRMAIGESTYIADVYKWAEEITPQLFLEAISLLEKDQDYTLKYADANSLNSLRCYPRIPSDSEINWSKSVVDIHRLIRASSKPFFGAYTYLNGEKFIIWRAEIVEDREKYCAIPGQIAEINKKDGSVIVITGNGKLKLTLITYKDNHRISPAVVVKSLRQRLGN